MHAAESAQRAAAYDNAHADSVQSAEHARQYDLVEPTRCTPLIASDPH